MRVQIRISAAQLRRAKQAAAIRLKSVSHLVSVGADDLFTLFHGKLLLPGDREAMLQTLRERYPRNPEEPRRKTTISIPQKTREHIWGIATAALPPLSVNDTVLMALETEIEDTLTEEK